MRPTHLRQFAVSIVVLLVCIDLSWQTAANAKSPLFPVDSAPANELAPTHDSADSVARRVGDAAIYAAKDDVSRVYFSQTGYHLTNRYGFLDYWRSQGQMLLFGMPLTEEIEENGRTVQYFERARFEFDAQSGRVQLGAIGRELFGARSFAVAAPLKKGRFFAETGHNVWGKFLHFWEKRGGAERFGLPLSEEFTENGRVVQYFERARFEYHPEDMPTFYRQQERRHGFLLATLHEVQLTPLGKQMVTARRITSPSRQTMASVPEWTPTLWQRRIEVDLSSQQLRAYEGSLMVYQAPVATGRDDFNTPVGTYAVARKLEKRTMRGTLKGETWKVPNVPWVMYFNGGVAIHGTYWHNQFGTGFRLSHGCVNVGMDDAEWLYTWASVGTPVVVRQ